MDGPLFRPLRHNGKQNHLRRTMSPDAIDRLVRKYAAAIGQTRGYSAHSMRATFITTALENGALLEDVQRAAGHRNPSTTKLYDRRGSGRGFGAIAPCERPASRTLRDI
jgi:integrase/recombinase XerD